MSYSNPRDTFSSGVIDLTSITDHFILAPLVSDIVIHKVGILTGTAGSDGLLTVTFQRTAGGTGGTDTTVKALIITAAETNAAGTIVYADVTPGFVIGPGDYLNLSVPAETSGTASAVSYALVEYSILDAAAVDDASLTAST